jgi:hypothetical protein
MKTFLKIWVISSTLFALTFLMLFLGTLSIPSGGGQMKYSPGEKLFASASSLRNGNPISPDYKVVYYEFTVSKIPGATPIQRVLVYPLGTNDEMYFRELPEIIDWATNSSEVTFTTPDVVIKLNLGSHQ